MHSKKEDFIGWTSPDGNLEVIGIAGKGEDGRSLYKVTCKICSQDNELFPDRYFTMRKGDLLRGRKPCGCSKRPLWTEDQYMLLARRSAKDRFIILGLNEVYKGQNTKVVCECLVSKHKWVASLTNLINNKSGCRQCVGTSPIPEEEALERCLNVCKKEGYKPLGFVDNTYTTVLSKFEYECPEHGKQVVKYNHFINSNSRCPECAKEKQGVYGYYENKSVENDSLYVLSFNGEYIKVGRSFDIVTRIKRLKSQSKCTNIKIVVMYHGIHKTIYKTEQMIHKELREKGFDHKDSAWSTETFNMDCLPFLLNRLQEYEDNMLFGEIKMAKYKMCYCDFDTCLYRAAKSCQKDFIIVTEKATGTRQRFDGVSKFYGLGPSKSKGWIGKQNKIRESLGQPLLTVDDFTIEEHAELVDDFDTVIQNALSQLDYAVGRIKRASEAEDYRLCIGGNGNWRYDKAHIKPYKGMRKPKPLLFLEVKEAFVSKYKNKVIIVDNCEVDDRLGIIGWQNYQNYVKTGVYENILSYVDKDLLSIISPHFNYDKPEEGISIPTPTEAAFHFCSQLLSGDLSTDNIQGLPTLTKEFQEKYGLRKTKGIGKETAHKILEGLSIKEMFERVVEAYRGYYGDVKQPFTSFRGEVFQWNYLDYLKENALLLWMQRYENQLYDIEDTLKLLKIEY